MNEARGTLRRRGFTLIEQVVVSAIVATLACMAAPALGQLVGRSRLQAAQSDLVSALQQTRALAIKARRRAMLCPTRDGRRCADDLHWETGWLAGHYLGDQADQLDGAVARVDGGHEQLTIVSTAGRRRIRFQPDGTAGGSNASLTVCRVGHADGALAVRISNAGRVYGARATATQATRCAQGD